MFTSAKSVNNWLIVQGHPEFYVDKAEGVWYLLGGGDKVVNDAERCLHVMRLAELRPLDLEHKINELTKE